MDTNLDSPSFGFMIRPESIKTCPRCSSVFINEKRCEECGFIPEEERLGPPYGERSFYALKENYWKEAPLWQKLFPRFESKSSDAAKEYKKFLFLRYRLLLDFFSKAKADHPARAHFYIELKALVEELLTFPLGNELLLKTLPHAAEEKISPLIEEIARIVRTNKA